MTQSDKIAKTINQLSNFPFKTYDEFCLAHKKNKIKLQISRPFVRQWAMQSRFSPTWLKLLTIILTWLPYMIILFYAVIIVLLGKWLYLLGGLLIYKAIAIFNPGSSFRFPILQPILLISTIVFFAFSIYFNNSAAVALAIGLLLLWIDAHLVYLIPFKYLDRNKLVNELNLCYLWQGNAFQIEFYNGDCYSYRFNIKKGIRHDYP